MNLMSVNEILFAITWFITTKGVLEVVSTSRKSQIETIWGTPFLEVF